eukprot:s412_g39.t1
MHLWWLTVVRFNLSFADHAGLLIIKGGALPPSSHSFELGPFGAIWAVEGRCLHSLRRCTLPSASFASVVQEPRRDDLHVNPVARSPTAKSLKLYWKLAKGKLTLWVSLSV